MQRPARGIPPPPGLPLAPPEGPPGRPPPSPQVPLRPRPAAHAPSCPFLLQPGWRRRRLRRARPGRRRRESGLCGSGSARGAWRAGGGACCATTPRPAWRRRGRRGGGRGARRCTRGWRRGWPGARGAAPARPPSRRRCWRPRAACCSSRRRRGAARPRPTCGGCWGCGRRGGCACAGCSSPRWSTRRPATPRPRSTARAAATWRPPGPSCRAACWTWASGAAGGGCAPACATATSTPRSSAPSRRACATSTSTTCTRPATSASSSRSTGPSSWARSTSARRRAGPDGGLPPAPGPFLPPQLNKEPASPHKMDSKLCLSPRRARAPYLPFLDILLPTTEYCLQILTRTTGKHLQANKNACWEGGCCEYVCYHPPHSTSDFDSKA